MRHRATSTHTRHTLAGETITFVLDFQIRFERFNDQPAARPIETGRERVNALSERIFDMGSHCSHD
jgi:hypothetical protein